jgi:hypothetical protein
MWREVVKKLVKVTGYILVSVFLTLVASQVFWAWLEVEIPVQYFPVVNLVLVAIAEAVKQSFPDTKVSKLI